MHYCFEYYLFGRKITKIIIIMISADFAVDVYKRECYRQSLDVYR